MLGRTPGRGETDRVLDVLVQPQRRRLLFALYEEVNQKGGERVHYDRIPSLQSDSLSTPRFLITRFFDGTVNF